MKNKKTLKKLPSFKTDKQAERFVAEADLTDFDLSNGKPMRFEFDKKTAQINLRMSEGLLQTLKERAQMRGIPYQRFIRETLENALK